MAPMHYLTVQDILWINYQVTNTVQDFDFAKLEEATFYQYGYGASKDLSAQAGRFIEGFLSKKPLQDGNEATALIALVAFVRMNGHTLRLSDSEAVAWVKAIASGSKKGVDAVQAAIEEAHDDHHGLVPPVQQICKGVLTEYAQSVGGLTPAKA